MSHTVVCQSLILRQISFLGHCKWSEWGEWSPCSETCGEGIQARERLYEQPPENNENPCEIGKRELKTCNLKDCHGEILHL